MKYALNVITENNAERYILCDEVKNYYTINKLLFDILSARNNDKSNAEICDSLNKGRTSNFITEIFIEQSVSKANAIIDNKNTPTEKKDKYIKYKITLIKEGQLLKTYKILTPLFNKLSFITLSIFSIFLGIVFIVNKGLNNLNLLYTQIVDTASIANLSIIFLLMLLVVLIHEIGHATASFKFGVKPKEIGAGLYFMFPVLYTNVTNVWSLPSKKRIMVNFGGIYFQLIVNIFLIAFIYLDCFKSISFLLFVTNSTSMLVSFNPFFRYDGYWLFSDFFGVSNLKNKSTTLTLKFIKFPTRIKNYILHNKITKATVVYAILNVAFWMLVLTSVSRYLIKTLPDLFSPTHFKEAPFVQYFISLITCFLIFIWIFSGIKTIYFNLLKNNNHAKQ